MRTPAPFLLGLALGLGSPAARAQLRPGEPARLPAFDAGVASGGSVEAAAVNPANVALIPATELRWTGRFLDDRSSETAQGHTLAGGFRIPWVDFATALRLDLVDPPTDAALRSFGLNANHQWLTCALAVRPSAALALGGSVQGSWSSHSAFDGLRSWSLGASTRISDYLALGVVGHDLNRPRGPRGLEVSPAYHGALALRPLATKALELELGAAYVDGGTGYWIPRASLGVDVPALGRLSGDFAVTDATEERGERRWQAGLRFALRLNDLAASTELGIGTVAGDGLGPDAEYSAHSNLVTTAAIRGFRERPGAGSASYALRVRIEDAPSARRQVALLRRLWSIATDEPEVQAVLLQIRAGAGSLAYVEELRDALALLRSRGKKVLCQLDDAGGATLYLCSAADRIVMSPAGRIRFAGFSARYFYVPRLLEKLGIRAEYARIGAHKSAPEMFSHDGASDVAREDHVALLQEFERHLVWGIAVGRKLAPEQLRQRLADGPFTPEAAQAAGLVDRVLFDDQVAAELDALAGRALHLRDERAPIGPERHGRGRAVAIIHVDGDMIDGRSRKIPLLGVSLVGSYTVADAIRRAAANPGVGAIVLRADTPGGSALAADVIWRELALAKQRKPVVVSIGSVGASAGYYIATAGMRVYASPLSVTGSIGVFAGKVDASALLRKLGISIETYKMTARADADSLFRPLTADERRELERKVGQFYDLFLDRVSRGRTEAGVPLTKRDVDAVGQGSVWTGSQAQPRKLVDELGGLRQALAYARNLARLPEDAPILEMPDETGPLVLRALGLARSNAPSAAELAVAAPLKELTRVLAPLTVHDSEWPLLRLEFLLTE